MNQICSYNLFQEDYKEFNQMDVQEAFEKFEEVLRSDEMRLISKSIRAELRRPNSLYARARLDNKDSRETWQTLMHISGIKSSFQAPAAVDIDSLNESFINSGTALSALPN
ncbi:unnamed protein product [Echinostoma caproni]|uniref:Uncharacterized protein n=1 Tax=Echinostoma caproni TaxID=27848 RepID=A0A183A4Y5_9TREM|nr:unnamed protein product [Echinostoma caproni]